MTKSTKASKLNSAALALSASRRSPNSQPSNGLASKGQRVNSHGVNSQGTKGEDTTTGKSVFVDSISLELSELLTTRYGGVNIYVAVMLLLAIAIIWTAVLTADQVHQYHQSYMTLQDMKTQHRKLQIEQQRLIIEQQTFSATPQIASRAITELGMYSPSNQEKLILQPAPLSSDPFTNTASDIASTLQEDGDD